jgi:hypothetical protein
LQRRGARRIQKREKPQKNLEIAVCQKHTMSFGANIAMRLSSFVSLSSHITNFDPRLDQPGVSGGGLLSITL